GGGHDGAAVAGMGLDDLADPFRIEQVGKALRRLLRLYELGVVADDAQPDAPAGKQPIAVFVLGRVVARYILGHERGKDAIAFPDDEMRGVRAVDDVDGVDVARVLLADALEDALSPRALDAHGDARIFGLEGLADALG